MSSAAVVIGALRVNACNLLINLKCFVFKNAVCTKTSSSFCDNYKLFASVLKYCKVLGMIVV